MSYKDFFLAQNIFGGYRHCKLSFIVTNLSKRNIFELEIGKNPFNISRQVVVFISVCVLLSCDFSHAFGFHMCSDQLFNSF